MLNALNLARHSVLRAYTNLGTLHRDYFLLEGQLAMLTAYVADHCQDADGEISENDAEFIKALTIEADSAFQAGALPNFANDAGGLAAICVALIAALDAVQPFVESDTRARYLSRVLPITVKCTEQLAQNILAEPLSVIAVFEARRALESAKTKSN